MSDASVQSVAHLPQALRVLGTLVSVLSTEGMKVSVKRKSVAHVRKTPKLSIYLSQVLCPAHIPNSPCWASYLTLLNSGESQIMKLSWLKLLIPCCVL